jgi:hypothetical protein
METIEKRIRTIVNESVEDLRAQLIERLVSEVNEDDEQDDEGDLEEEENE